ncbi:MAG: Ig-like domain-containing protein, partial [Anaerolineaceae bacterium]
MNVSSTSLDGQDGDGFSFTLSEGSSEPQEATPIEAVQGDPLTSQEIQAILNRLTDLPVAETDQMELNLPEQVLPPPRPGETIEQAFPPDEADLARPEVTTGSLEVLRFSPEGEISVAPFISITFNQPMVPLGTLQQLSEMDVPVQVTPDLAGTWRWVGTKTLTFNYDSDLIDRLPKATQYTVTVPAGTKSASGNELSQDVTWSFSTPAPVITGTYPYAYEPQDVNPVFLIQFDQRVDPAAVLETIKVTADGKNVQVRLASETEIQADGTAASLAKYALEGRWLAFKAVSALPKDSEIVVTVGPGTPSAEGPLTTETAQSYNFRTYAPLKIENHGCAYGNTACYPLEPFYIRFNNPIDADLFKEEMISIQPAIAGATISLYGNTLNIKGATAGSTTYNITVDGSITDIYGQTLGRNTKLTFKVGQADS